jgi:hypothetical protein
MAFALMQDVPQVFIIHGDKPALQVAFWQVHLEYIDITISKAPDMTEHCDGAKLSTILEVTVKWLTLR